MTAAMFLALEAHHDARNVHRRYEIEVGADLFGELMVVIRYGRVGSRLRQQRFGGLTRDEAERLVRTRLRKRLAGQQRRGCGYEVCDEIVFSGAGWFGVLASALSRCLRGE